MKYCSSCKRLNNTQADVCSVCSAKVTDANPDSPVCVTVIKGTFTSMLENALKDEGIPFALENKENDIYNTYNAKISTESEYRLLVPFEYYNKAFDVCVGVGLASDEDRIVVEGATQEDSPSKTYEEKFEEKNGVKHRTWQMIWMIIFIVAACLIIWGIDWIAEYIKSFFI